MNWQEHIVSDKDVLLGKPAIAGTRISLEYIVSLFAQGWTEIEILENFPRLTKEAIQAVFAYLQDCIHDGLLFTPIRKMLSRLMKLLANEISHLKVFIT